MTGSGGERELFGDGHGRSAYLASLNDRIAAAAVRHHFGDSRIPFHCECGKASCRELALYTLREYGDLRQRRRPTLAQGHRPTGN